MNALRRRLLLGGIFVFSLILGLTVRASYDGEWYRPDSQGHLRPWAVEADCYERLIRVQRILHGDGLIQNFHPHENYPQGLIPSTTAPLDYCILALYFPLKLFTLYPLDWAGALVSPLLWVALLIFWAFAPLQNFRLESRLALLVSSATLYGFFWATSFGRPDHQSLILLLFGVALTAEFERWSTEGKVQRSWHLLTGFIWGLVLWTSLFEPVLIFLALVAFNLLARRRESLSMLVTCGTVLLIALVLEGIHIFIPTAQQALALENWSTSIFELRGMDFVTVIVRFSFLIFAWPLVACRILQNKECSKADLFLILVTTLLFIATLYQQRWIYYSTLGEVLVFARYFHLSQSIWRKASVAVIGGLALLYSTLALYSQITPNFYNQPSPDMELLSHQIDQPGALLAPWWRTSALSYFSGQPVVSCSSHCSVAGLIDTGRYFSSVSWARADLILDQRKVRWIVVYNDPRFEYPLLNGTTVVLGTPRYFHKEDGSPNPAAELTVAQKLIEGKYVPPQYRLRSIVNNYLLYEYEPTPSP